MKMTGILTLFEIQIVGTLEGAPKKSKIQQTSKLRRFSREDFFKA